ncbi:MAG: hypothetical protein ACE5JL_14480 [Dehalococcoidia bacterium]
MRLRSICLGGLLAAGLKLALLPVALANGGDEAEHTSSNSLLVVIPAVLAAVAVGYVMFRVFRGRGR